MKKVSPWLLGGLGLALVALATSQRKAIMLFGSKLVDMANLEIFRAQLPDRAQPYAEVILRAASAKGVDPFLIFALGDRETLWGTSSALDQPGPAGTGDGGHGRGLMQIDDRSNASWLASNDWTDPYTNVSRGAILLKQKLAFFETTAPVPGLTDGVTVNVTPARASKRGVSPGSYNDPRPLQGNDLWTAAIAAYNTGEGNVLVNLAVGKPAEFTSAGGDYASDVISRAQGVAAKYDNAVS